MKIAQAGHSTAAAMPAWLEGLLSEKFFSPCASHSSVKKSERNVYCLECTVAICQHCLPNHDLHRLLQIRRYVYHDVVRMQDIQKLIDCSYIQPYIINSAKAVFLNERPQPRPSKGAGNVCEFCERCLQDGYNFCSVGCKVKAFAKQGKNVQSLLSQDDSNLPVLGFATSSSSSCCLGETMMNEGMVANTSLDEDEYHEQQHSPNSVLGGPTPTSSGSTANNSLTWGGTMATATKKLRTSLMHSKPSVIGPVTPLSSVLPNSSSAAKLKALKRRKSTPQRSPTF